VKVIVGSLQYSPIFKSHCCAFGKQAETSGHSVKYLFSRKYAWMLDEDIKKEAVFFGDSESLPTSLIDGINYRLLQEIAEFILRESPDVIYLHNIHPLNYHIAKFAKAHDIMFIQHIHEPFVEDKSAYGGFHQYFLYIFEYLQGKLLEVTDVAVVSSGIAVNLFKRRYPNYSGKLILIPLMYEDFSKHSALSENRQYITFIGPPVPAKGPETFLKIVDYSNHHDLSLQYLLISRYPIEDHFCGIPNLTLYHKDQISDPEMAELLHQSLMTITPYTTARQSSVVLTSYMCGTPVLSSDIDGLRESVYHLKTGYLVDLRAPIEAWINGIEYISNNLEIISNNCRSDFVANYSEINWQKYLSQILRGKND
jgi:glycosyltransferase involved in cell wall biosynthesis